MQQLKEEQHLAKEERKQRHDKKTGKQILKKRNFTQRLENKYNIYRNLKKVRHLKQF